MTGGFPPNSRYYLVPERWRIAADGTEERFLARRIIPEQARYQVLDRYRPQIGERIEQVASAVFGDPEQYWKLCDANGSEEPAGATSPEGRLLIVPMPIEMSGDGNA